MVSRSYDQSKTTDAGRHQTDRSGDRLVDARIPLSSRNPDIDELGKNKYRLILMNKADLADRKATEQWSAFFKKKGYYVVSLDARSKNGMKSITDIIMEACKEKNGEGP